MAKVPPVGQSALSLYSSKYIKDPSGAKVRQHPAVVRGLALKEFSRVPPALVKNSPVSSAVVPKSPSGSVGVGRRHSPLMNASKRVGADLSTATQGAAPPRQSLRGLNLPGDRSRPIDSAVAALNYLAGKSRGHVGPQDLALLGDEVVATLKGPSADIAALRSLRPESLTVLEVKNGLGSTHTRFQQHLGGIPIEGAYASVHQGETGEVRAVHANLWDDPTVYPRSGLRTLSAIEARKLAMSQAGVYNQDKVRLQSIEKVYFPTSSAELVLAWKVSYVSYDPQGDIVTLIDATTGKVLKHVDRTVYHKAHGYSRTARGRGFFPNPLQGQGLPTGLADKGDESSELLRSLMKGFPLENLREGTDKLIGAYVDVASFDSPFLKDVDAQAIKRGYIYDRDDPRFEQVMVYFTIDWAQQRFHSLGFDDGGPAKNGVRDFQTQANAHWNDADQSFYMPSTGNIHFGDGGVDDAEDMDIILHEFGHAVQDAQNVFILMGGSESKAMSEGFGDYLAASFLANMGRQEYQLRHAAAVGEWDATAYSSDDPPNLRRVDTDKRYPNDMTGAVHDDGEIWSRALWDVRGYLGADITDTLVLEHHFYLPFNATMRDAALEILQVDRELYEGAHIETLQRVFVSRGLLPAPEAPPEVPEPAPETPSGVQETPPETPRPTPPEIPVTPPTTEG
ncbi:MAG: M36 family metallopeptidase [Myxococcota bacterium]